ncbi:MAG: DUF6471 domain-containing protein [Sphingomonas sp.]|uniref:DUF6471 domain-containing protein n=1 Tax=Sphingomonas sp. TaxID=28214 RepID=UPI002A72E531|nr:DUF6471 domain-containing protein [Sphingomonas sp.]
MREGGAVGDRQAAPESGAGAQRDLLCELIRKLDEIGVMDFEPIIRDKISRGNFTAVFLLQCLEAIGAQFIKVSE